MPFEICNYGCLHEECSLNTGSRNCFKFIPMNNTNLKHICKRCNHSKFWHYKKENRNINELEENIEKLIKLNMIKNNHIDQLENRFICCICNINQSHILLRPCGHANFCYRCLQNIDTCPICRKDIINKIKYIPL